MDVVGSWLPAHPRQDPPHPVPAQYARLRPRPRRRVALRHRRRPHRLRNRRPVRRRRRTRPAPRDSGLSALKSCPASRTYYDRKRTEGQAHIQSDARPRPLPPQSPLGHAPRPHHLHSRPGAEATVGRLTRGRWFPVTRRRQSAPARNACPVSTFLCPRSFRRLRRGSRIRRPGVPGPVPPRTRTRLTPLVRWPPRPPQPARPTRGRQ